MSLQSVGTVISGILLLFVFQSCYVSRWNGSEEYVSYPQEVICFWKEQEDVYVVNGSVPGYAYTYDVAEKDALYDKSSNYQFDRVELRLAEKTPKGKV